jgi:vacuolar-type H+-ATPase subunit E/Vma4
MPLETIFRDELQKEIEMEVDAIRRRAQEQGEALEAEAGRWAREWVAEEARRLDEECELRTRRTLARIDQEQRNALLRLRQQEVDRVFQLAAERLVEMQTADPESYGELMAKVFENCLKLLPEEPLLVRLGPGLENLGKRLAASEGVTVAADGQIFGLLVEVEQGRLHCDGTIPRLLQRLRREREAELEVVLFGGAP